MSVALVIQQAVRLRHFVVCGHIFPHYLMNGTIFEKKKSY
jgi:hypothetical protein